MKTITASIAAVTFVVSIAGAGYAAGPDHSVPGTPGTPNCKGQTMAFLAQAAKNGLVDEAFRGIGGIARGADASAAQVVAVVDAFCAS